MQQQIENQFITNLLAKFEHDESEATREVLEQIDSNPLNRLDYIKTFNMLLNTRGNHTRQRRDVAAIARLIADSTIFATLEGEIEAEVANGKSTEAHSMTIEVTKLISNICNENPHFVDNILTNRASILDKLFALYSNQQTTPNEGDGISTILNFLHNVSLKESTIRGEKVGPCLEALIENILTQNKFCSFISQKRFQNFVGSLFKFHSNVNLVAHHVYASLIRAARSLNDQYKKIAEIYKSISQRIANLVERTTIMEKVGFADKKLIAIMKLFQRARTNIFSKFDAFSFTGLLKIFVKIAIMRPVALLNQPIENKLLITIINDLMINIQEYREHIQLNKLIPLEGEKPVGELEEEEADIQPPMEEEKVTFSPIQIERFKNESKSFENISEVSKHFSQTYFKIIKGTIQTLNTGFQCLKYKDIMNGGFQQAAESYEFLINILTVRLERILSWMLKLFPTEQLKKGTYYRDIVALLLKLLPYYFEAAINAETKAILEQVNNMEDVSTQSEGSVMRYIMENIDEESVKTFIQGKLLEKINIFSTIYQIILKFVYHLVDDEETLNENMIQFIHVFIKDIQERHINAINVSQSLSFKQIETLRLSLKVVTELFHNNVNPSLEDQIKNRAKLYRYCSLVQNFKGQNLFTLLGDILNNLQKHSIEKTNDLMDRPENREQVIKTIFAKIIIQRSKTYVNYLTLAHLSRAAPDFSEKTLEEVKQHYEKTYEGYYAYTQCMNEFVMNTCPSNGIVLYKEEILGTVLDRNLDYGLFVEDSYAYPENIAIFEGEMVQTMKKRLDNSCNELFQWVLANTHRYLHRLPLLIKKLLHFQLKELRGNDGIENIWYQEQQKHVQAFIIRLSQEFTRSSLLMIDKKLDLKIKVRKGFTIAVEEIDIKKEVQRVANLIVILGELIKLLAGEEYYEPNHPQISPNFVFSTLKLITEILTVYKAEEGFPTQADDLIHSSFWMTEMYLNYFMNLKEITQRRKKDKLTQKREMKKRVNKQASKKRKFWGRLKCEDSQSIQEKEADEEEIDENKTKRKRRNRKKKKRMRKVNRVQEPKGLNKSGSKSNLLEQSQVKNEVKSKSHKKQERKSQKTLQKVIREYLHFICEFLGKSPIPIIKNKTISYLLYFISRHMHRSIIQTPPYNTFEINLSEIIPHLLKVKICDSKIPGYHLSLCKLALQLFDDCHIKIDYELAIKRYLFQHTDTQIGLTQFVKMLKDTFKQVSQSTSNFVDIVAIEGEGESAKTVKVPFARAKYEELLQDKSKKYTIQLKEGVDLHLINTKPDSNNSRRKASAPNEEGKALKVSDYSPEGELFTCIQQIITHSIRTLIGELDKCTTFQAFENEINYQTAMEPFTIRATLQTLQYLARQSPSLGPFIAKFKCKRILLNEMNSENLKNRERVVAFTMKLLTGNTQYNENMQEVGFLSVLLRLFSPLVVNAISGLIFELCLDSTPLVQITQGKIPKNSHVSFGSVVRLKVVEQIQNILFGAIELNWLFRKLCLLNLLTVLINIRQMSKLFIENSFISKLYKAFYLMRLQLNNNAQQHERAQLSGNYITRIISPFYLVPLSILQELNISFHYSKKLNKGAQKISICTVLSRQSINAQLISIQTLKRYKFKLDWPYHMRRDTNILQTSEGEQAELYAEVMSSESESLSEQSFEESMDSDENSSFMRYSELEEQMPESSQYNSYMSLDEPHEQLLNEEWQYSNDNAMEGQDEEGILDYPDDHDHIIEMEDGANGEFEHDLEEVDEEMEDDEGEGESEQNEIDEYLQIEGREENPEDMRRSLIDELSISENSDNFFSNTLQTYREFSLNTVNEEDYYMNVNALLNFQKVQSIPRISKAEKKQVHLLRFFLQLVIFEKRKAYDEKVQRLMSPHEIKEEKLIEDCFQLKDAFEKDEHIRVSEFIEYNQIYRYDHYHKETPKLVEEVEKQFVDHIQAVRTHCRRRNGFIHSRENLIEILPGWNITEVHDQPPNEYSSQMHEEPGLGENNSSGSHIHVNSEEEINGEAEAEEADNNEIMEEEMNEEQHIANIDEILRSSNLNMSTREFMRLDPEIQQDILMNIAAQQEVPVNSPHNSSEGVEIPHLEIHSLEEEGLEQGRVIQNPNLEHSPFDFEQNIEQQRNELRPESQEVVPEVQQQPQQAQLQSAEQQRNHPVDQVYRKMSLEHTKKISKDVIEALNKDGKNNSKFHEIEESELQSILEIFFLTTEIEHSRYPYPLIETLCINTHNLKRLVSNLLLLLHLAPSRFVFIANHKIVRIPKLQTPEEQLENYTQKIYPGVVVKILHLLTHLTKIYSISMSFLKPNNDVCSDLKPWERKEQSQLSSFEMLILLLREKIITESPMILSFLIGVLDNITMHHFYKNVHKIVEKSKESSMENEEIYKVKVNEDSVYLLGELLQSDFVGDNLALVSKIIMRLSCEEDNLRNFINYLEQLVKQLTDQALDEVMNNEENGADIHGHLKIVNLMSIFYEMVKAFETYPTSLERHLEVLGSLRRIVEYEKLQLLCQKALKALFESGGKDIYNKIGEVIDCFFVLHEIATITSNRSAPKKQEENEHNHIAQLGEIGLVELRRSQVSDEQDLYLGRFNLSKLWKESINHPNFKIYVNNNIKRKMTEAGLHSRRASAFEMPIIKIASSTPHLLSFDNKYALFKSELKRLRGKEKYQMIHISLKRQDVFEDSFENFMTRSVEKLRGKLKIEFQDEEGEDAGGITRQWFQLLSREMFNPNYGLFRSGSGGHTYHPSSTSYYNQRHLDYFKFIGRITGKALYDGYLLDAYFTPAFYKHILALPITYHDMQQQDYEYFKSLTWILESSPIQDFIELTFTYDCDNFGEIQTKELIPGGTNIIVTEQNKLQYVQLIAYAKMATSIKMQLESYLTGLHELIPHRLLSIFSEKELEIMISGRPTIDIEDLRRNTELVNYQKNDSIIVWLFEVLESFDMELRTAFIQFVTGSSRVPVEGFKDLRGMNGVQRFNIHREFQEERLPRAHTCFNQLDLPNYKSKEILIEKLMYAITEGKEGFGMI